jgi:creatinine amidohydrolase
MRLTLAGFCLAVIAASAFAGAQAPVKPAASPGIALADISWKEAETALTESSVVVIPLGAAAIQHGPHLKLNNNERLARYLTTRVQAAASVVIAPTLTYHFYPSFLEYPGSTTLNEDTARDMTVEIVRSLSKSGPRRFYVLNTGRPTVAPLSEAAKTLANDGILLGYTDAAYRLRDVVALQQARITVAHADEVATSMMLFVDPAAVDMKKAVREYASGSGALTRKKDAPGVFSESGVLGDATVATREKGQQLVDALLAGVLEDIENIRKATLPAARTVPPPPPPAPAPRPAAGRSSDRGASGCTPGDERTIRAIGEKFQLAWRNQDVPLLMTLFGKEADMRHPDGTIERTAEVIGMNRIELFRKREYRGSVHTVTLNDIRCLSADIAVADGKWELRMDTSPMTTSSGRKSSAGIQIFAGWCTLVLRNPGWSIEAWRYTVNPQEGPPPPTVLKQPGFLGRGGGGEH